MHLVACSRTEIQPKQRRAKASVTTGGLVGWVMEAFSYLMANGSRRPAMKQMRIVETLAIGAKKQLLLVSCGGERFLVGTGSESVQTMMRVRRETGVAANVEELAR